MTRIGIIVDNPKRDLNGAILNAYHVNKMGGKAFIIPMYYQGYDIPLLKLDAIIANYIRPANEELLANYKKLGTKVIISDTEGGILSSDGADSPANWAKSFKTKNYHKIVDLYSFWGSAIREEFVKYSGLTAENLITTGCPRYDFCNSKWSDFLSTDFEPGYILVNMNFSAINPKFSRSFEDEIKAFTAHGWDKTYVIALIKELKEAHIKYIDVLKKLAKDLPNERFIIRPHPFEDSSIYHKNFKVFKNIKIDGRGDVLNVIKDSKCILHLNCGTSVESNLLNKLPINLEFLNTNLQVRHTPLPRKLSYNVNNYKQLVDILNDLSGANYSFEDVRKEHIEPWFYKNDGGSSKRLIDATLKLINNGQPKSIYPIMSLKGSRNKTSLLQKAQGFFSFLFGSLLLSKIREKLDKERKNKSFSKDDLSERICLISKIDNNEKSLLIPRYPQKSLSQKLSSVEM